MRKIDLSREDVKATAILSTGYAMTWMVSQYVWGGMAYPVILASVLLASILIVLSVIDLRLFRLPDSLNLLLAIGGVVITLWFSRQTLMSHVVTAAAILAGLAAMNFTYSHLRHRDGFGIGDMKLAAAGTLWVGPWGILSVFLWSTCTGLLHFLVTGLSAREGLSSGSRIPFGPHLALGIWLVWLFGPITS